MGAVTLPIRHDAGAGLPVVLLHGFPLDGSVWDDVVVAMRGRHGVHGGIRVVVPDLRGFGQSKDTSAFGMSDLAGDVAGLIRRLGGRAVVAGISMGGYVALQMARDHRELLCGLGIVNSRPQGDTPEAKMGRDKMAETALAAEQRGGPTVGSLAVAQMMFPKMLAEKNAKSPLAARLMKIMEGCRPGTIAHACAAMRDRPDFTGDLPKLDIPAAVVVGDRDAIISVENARSTAALLVNSRLTVIEECGHMAPLEEPGQVADALTELALRAGA